MDTQAPILTKETVDIFQETLNRLASSLQGETLSAGTLAHALEPLCPCTPPDRLPDDMNKLLSGQESMKGVLSLWLEKDPKVSVEEKLDEYLTAFTPEEQKGSLLGLFQALKKDLRQENEPEEAIQSLADLPVEDLKNAVAPLLHAELSARALDQLRAMREAVELTRQDGENFHLAGDWSDEDKTRLAAAALYACSVNGTLPTQLAAHPEFIGAAISVQGEAVQHILEQCENLDTSDAGGLMEIVALLIGVMLIMTAIALPVILTMGIVAGGLSYLLLPFAEVLGVMLITIGLFSGTLLLCSYLIEPLEKATEAVCELLSNVVFPGLRTMFEKLKEMITGAGRKVNTQTETVEEGYVSA